MIFCAVQVLGVITSTIGVAIAFNKFDALNDQMTHTKLGVAIMVLVWVQVLLSVIRPKRYTQFYHNCSCCYLPIYMFTESQNHSLLIPFMLDQLFSTNSLEHVRIIFRSENSKRCWSIERSPRIESLFPLGREFVQTLWNLFFLGREFVWGFWKLLFGEGNLCKDFESSFSGNEFAWGFWKLFYWEGNLSNDFDSLFCGKGIRVQELKTFLGQRKFFSWLRKSKSWT